jgi:hypothetical protein
MSDEKQLPLTEKQVKEQARKLETLANQFLDKNESDAFDKWHSELRQVAKHGVPSTTDVFKQVKKDFGAWDPRGPQVLEAHNAQSAQLTIQSNRTNRIFGSKQYIGSIVDSDEVFSMAKARNGKHLGEISIQKNVAVNLMEMPLVRPNPFELFPRKATALDLKPIKPANPFEVPLKK